MKTSIKHDIAGSGGSPVIKLESPADYKLVMAHCRAQGNGKRRGRGA